MTTETVRQAAAMPDMNHRDPAFVEILRDTKKRLLQVYPQVLDGDFRSPGQLTVAGQAWRPYLIGGSGTAAVESMITSCVSEGPVLLVDSGYYSGRMRSKLEAHGIPFNVLQTKDWQAPIDLDELARHLQAGDVRFEALLTTHNETTTGRLHALSHIGEICARTNTKLLVDAMSSFGADEIDFTHIDAIASSANKCLHGLPGISFVLVRDWLADEMRQYPPRSVYLSLPFYEGDAPPLTPPMPILSALNQALMEMGTRGSLSRRETYLNRAAMLRQGLEDRGFRFAIPVDDMSCTLTTASIPPGWSADAWFQANLDSGFMTYGTKGELREKWFQVANMGEVTDVQLRLWLAAVDDILASKRAAD